MTEVENPSNRYGEKLAAGGLDFVVQPGIVTGFPGPNGAGKPTTMPAALQRFPTAGCGGMSTPVVVRSRCWCIRVNAGSARNTTTGLSSGSGHHLPCHPRSFHDGVETDHHGTTTSTAASCAGIPPVRNRAWPQARTDHGARWYHRVGVSGRRTGAAIGPTACAPAGIPMQYGPTGWWSRSDPSLVTCLETERP